MHSLTVGLTVMQDILFTYRAPACQQLRCADYLCSLLWCCCCRDWDEEETDRLADLAKGSRKASTNGNYADYQRAYKVQ
jgi:hypothetical protein